MCRQNLLSVGPLLSSSTKSGRAFSFWRDFMKKLLMVVLLLVFAGMLFALSGCVKGPPTNRDIYVM